MNQDKIIETLLLNTNVNFLLGAGASYDKKDNLLNFPLMFDLLQHVTSCQEVNDFYSTLSVESESQVMVKNIFDSYLYSDSANIESFLSVLDGVDLYIVDSLFKNKVITIRETIKKEVRDRLLSSNPNTVLDSYQKFYTGLRKLSDMNGIKNQVFNIFTTNYDMMNELAMETLNIHYYAGFEGIVKRKFNLTYYNYDFIDRFEVNKIRVEDVPMHINLYKLHGSLSWYLDNEDNLIERNPFREIFIPEIIYPSIEKFKNTNLIISYSALMRELSSKLCMTNTTLFVTGMSMGDEHINKIIENALSINTFHLVVFCATDDLIEQLKEKYRNNQNVVIVNNIHYFNKVGEILMSLNEDTIEEMNHG